MSSRGKVVANAGKWVKGAEMDYNENVTSEQEQVKHQPKARAVPRPKNKIFRGQASYYTGPGPNTASNQPFDRAKIAGAMTKEKLPTFPIRVIVTYKRPDSGKIIRLPVLINDHGPFATDNSGMALRPLRPDPTRIIDLTPGAFTALTGAPVAHGVLDDVTVEVPGVDR